MRYESKNGLRTVTYGGGISQHFLGRVQGVLEDMVPWSQLANPGSGTSHVVAVNALHISDDNERLYSGDASGTVVLTSTRSFRPLAQWQAHQEAILGVAEWEKQIITFV